MNIIYTHGMGGSRQAQPEIEEVFNPLGHTVTRIEVLYHGNLIELATRLATLTFGDLCLIIDETADKLIEQSRRFASQDYAVVGDSPGGLISVLGVLRHRRERAGRPGWSAAGRR